MPNIDPLISDELRVDVKTHDETIRCIWSGKSAQRHPSRTLGPWFETVLQAAEAESTAIAMHFEELVHFNSSTIGAIVQLIQSARTRGVPLTLAYKGEHRWQRLSFEALQVFDQGDGLLTLRRM